MADGNGSGSGFPEAFVTALTEALGDDRQAWAQMIEAIRAGRNLAQLQEPGWTELGEGSSDDLVAAQIDRARENRQARWYYFRDPIASQAIMLHNAYTFGRGVSIKAKDPDVQRWLDVFWDDPRNRHTLTRAQAQWTLSRERQLDGEIFFVFYVSTLTGRVTVRTFDPSEIPQQNGVITTAGDPTFPTYFRREFQTREFDFKRGEYKLGDRQVAYYPDYRNAGSHPSQVRQHWPPNTEIYVMHFCSNPLGGRGLTHMAQGLPWIKAFKGHLEDHATLLLALATFAFRQKIKGNRQAVERVLEQWGRYETEWRYGTGDNRERRQGANVFVENEASQLEQMKTDSGSSNAYTSGRMFRQNAGLGAGGIFEHYLGDPSTGNLATSTAMELPMLKMFEFEQQMWEDVIRDIAWFVLVQGVRYAHRDYKLGPKAVADVDRAGGSPIWVLEPNRRDNVDLGIDVIFPPIVQSDIAVWAAALASIAQAETMTGQQAIPPEYKAQRALQLIGVDDVGAIVEEMKANGFQLNGVTPEQAGERFAASLKHALQKLRKVQEADGDPPDVGDPLPKDEAEKVERITRAELNSYFDLFAELPELDDLLQDMGLTVEDVDD